MVPYYGDFPEDATVYLPFNTFSSDDPSASVTVTDLADADIMVHKDGGTTQIATDGATVAINYDSITGNHLITIDTSVHADYSTGSEYAVRIEGVTIDGATVNAWIGSFSIERAGGALALLKNATYGLDQLVRATTPANTLDISANGNAGIDWGNIDNKTTANDLSATDIQLVDTCTTNTDMRGTDSAALASVCTEERLAELDGANLPTDIAAIPTNPMLDTEDGSSFDSIPDMATATAQTTAQNDLDTITGADGVTLASAQPNYAPNTVVPDAAGTLAAYDPPTKAELDSGFAGLNDITAAEVKTAIEASGSDLDTLVKALVNKMIITEADGNTEMFNDSNVSLGSIAGCFTTDGTYTTRKRLVP